MTQEEFNTVSRKGAYLSYQERCQIAILKKEGYSNRYIAKALDRVPQTLNNEVNRGTITQVNQQKQNGRIHVALLIGLMKKCFRIEELGFA